MVRKFRVVKANDPAAVFDDLDALRQEMPAVATKRARSIETFARIPHDQAAAMRAIGGVGWLIVIEIDRLILKGRGRNPVRLTNHRMHQLGISRQSKRYHLRQLEMAGIVKVQSEARKWTVVTLLWFPVQT
jgi:DNA-binding transcriptional ArsR family regulator